MKKVLVTGGLGFIGSNWINRFHKEYDILVVDALYTGSNVCNMVGEIGCIKCDICNFSADAFKTFNPDVVLNFAAESHVDRSIEDPLSFIKSNVLGTANLLELVRTKRPDAKFVQISTDEVFGDLSKYDQPFNEQSKYNPRNPYSASKAAADHVVRAYHETYGLNTTTTNCCNNYGPRQYSEKLIPVILKNALTGKPIPIYGNGKNIREWIYVDDHNDAITTVMENAEKGTTYCIGTEEERSNITLANEICDLLDKMFPKKEGSYKDQIEFVEDRLGHDFRYALESEKIQKELKWKPKVKFETGLKQTVEWYYNKFSHQGLFINK